MTSIERHVTHYGYFQLSREGPWPRQSCLGSELSLPLSSRACSEKRRLSPPQERPAERHPENYPQAFSHISSVERIGENLYRWTVKGPVGIPIGWEGVITRMVPNTLVEWKSQPGSLIANSGTARFDPNYDASTRLHIRMFYRPPAGILGRFAADGLRPQYVIISLNLWTRASRKLPGHRIDLRTHHTVWQ